jgi:hypothetical protein
MSNKPTTQGEEQTAIPPKYKQDKRGNWFISPQKEDCESQLQQFIGLVGTQDSDAFQYLIGQLLPVVDRNVADKQYERMNQVMPLLRAIAPKDELEGMLAVQIIGIHAMAMEMMTRGMVSEMADGVNNNVNRVTKLTRTFITQLEALDKHRGKGQQKITVEHVTVNDGGQAIVGNVERGEEG